MASRLRLSFIALLAAAFLLVPARPAAAASFQIAGKVTDQSSSPLSGANIAVIDPSSSQTVASTTTAADGTYSVSVNAGTYNVQVTAPSGTGLGSAIALNEVIGNDTVLNFVLVAQGSVTFSGQLRDPHGQGIAGQEVSLNPVDGGAGGQAYTDSSGNYSINVAPGNYTMQLYSANQASNAPTDYNLTTAAFSLTQSTTLNLTLPEAQVSLQAQDANGNPVAGAAVYVSNVYLYDESLGDGQTANGPTSGGPYKTDSAGNATFWVLKTTESATYTLTVEPVSGSGLANTTVSGVTATNDTTRTVTVASPITVSGQLLDPHGQGIAGQEVSLNPVDGGAGGQAYTDSSGNYSINVAPGNYTMQLYSANQASNAPTDYNLTTAAFSLTQSTTLNLTLPEAQVSLQAQDANGNPVAGAAVYVSNVYLYDESLGDGQTANGPTSGGPYKTDSAGNATFWVLKTTESATYTLTIEPPANSPLVNFNLDSISITSDTTELVSLQYVHAPPVTSLSLSPDPDSSGNYSDPTTVTLSASAYTGYTIADIYYTVDGGAQKTYSQPFAVSGNGQHTITYWSVDNIGVPELPKSRTFTIAPQDSTPPVITPSLTGPQGNNGWYTGPVKVEWAVSDPESGIASSSGCDTTTLSTDTTGTTLTCSAVNGVGLQSSADVTVKIDQTGPEIDAAATTADGMTYTPGTWTNQDVTVTFTCHDVTSGIASCPAPLTVSSEGAGQSVSGTAYDNAGNSTTYTFGNIQVDPAAPVVNSPALTAGNNGPTYTPGQWSSVPITLTPDCSDSVSGIAAAPPVTLTTEGPDQSITYTCVTNAGTVVTKTVGGINIDKTPPLISAGATTADGKPYVAGTWTNQAVTVHFTCSDPPNASNGTQGSGLYSCPQDVTVSSEGSGQSVSGTAYDNAGNQASASFGDIDIDTTAPSVSCSSADGSWHAVNVSIACTAQDSASGLANASDANFSLSTAVADGTSDADAATGSRSVCDNAGYCTQAGPIAGTTIDPAAPAITASATAGGQPYISGTWTNQTVTVHFTCSDGGSGIQTCPVDTAVSGEGQNQLVSGTAYDNVGNQASATFNGIDIDKTAPAISITGVSDGGVYWQSVQACVTVTDGGNPASGLASKTITLDGTAESDGCT